MKGCGPASRPRSRFAYKLPKISASQALGLLSAGAAFFPHPAAQAASRLGALGAAAAGAAGYGKKRKHRKGSKGKRSHGKRK